MLKSEVRAAAYVFLRDAGIAKHWPQASLDQWLDVGYRRMITQVHEANPDFFSNEELIATSAAGTYALAGLAKTFLRPLQLQKKSSLASIGIPYYFTRPMRASDRTGANLAFIRAGITLEVDPREATSFGLEYLYYPTLWPALADGGTPDINALYHQNIALEGAICALTEGGTKAPGALGAVAAELRQSWLGYIGRAGQDGPIVCEVRE